VSYPWLQDVEEDFARRLERGRLGHALLLSGPEGLGKLELARGFMAALLCLEGRYPACGACRSCQLLRGGAHPDGHVLTFETRKNSDVLATVLTVDQVRALIGALQLTRTVSRCNVALLYPADAMNASAANALLKTLEEPLGEVFLLLVTSRPARLPATIRSRCQALQLRLPEAGTALDWLTTTVGSSPAEAEVALAASAGRPLIARRLIEEQGTRQYQRVNEVLDAVQAGRCEPAAALAEFAELDAEWLWSWLSLRAARETLAGLQAPARARRATLLQREADRNRSLLPTPVRRDLLLWDWLVQWAGLHS
jgi:DNA polymerase-3 subunit delta'